MSMKKPLFSTVLITPLMLGGLLMVLPFIWMILSAFKSNEEIMAINQTLLPIAPTLDNFSMIMKKFDFLAYFRNSLVVAVAKTALIVYTSTLCGYVFAKFKFRGRELVFGLVLGTMMIPWPVTIIPMYDLMTRFGWVDSWTSLIVPGLFSSFGIFMMRQFIDSIPDELLEAARMDGASEYYIFHRIIFPLCGNALSAIIIFHFLWSWDDFLWPYLMISNDELQLLPIALKNFIGKYYTNYGALFASATISVIPVLVVYQIFQKRFIQGVAMSGIKG
jgi:multiple sugar transport system permease protein/raffinose/stachyose/melibiose transport system permease protein